MYHNKSEKKPIEIHMLDGRPNFGQEGRGQNLQFMSRVHPIMRLSDGNISGHIAEFSRTFDELPQHGFDNDNNALKGGCAWMDMSIRKAITARAAHDKHNTPDSTPLLIPAPDILFHLADSSAECEAILAAIMNTLIKLKIHKSACLIFRDHCLLHINSDNATNLQAFRNHGLRLALDWRVSWKTRFDSGLARLFDTAIIDCEALSHDPDLLVRVYEAKRAQIPVIVQGAKWRDKDEFADLGACYIINPVCDC